MQNRRRPQSRRGLSHIQLFACLLLGLFTCVVLGLSVPAALYDLRLVPFFVPVLLVIIQKTYALLK